jgi:T-complex protein 1 subunit beta
LPDRSDDPLQATEERGENARLSSFVGAMALGDLVKSTLGPKGMNKILQSASTGEIMVTNDGATILKSIQLDNPAAKILVNISKVQDDEVGDGTTSVCVLSSELLREAEKLVTNLKVHPQTVVEGYRIASKAALEALKGAARDNGADPEAFRKDLFNIARTTLSSKVLAQDKDYFANLAVDAVLRLKVSRAKWELRDFADDGPRARRISNTFRSSRRLEESLRIRTSTRDSFSTRRLASTARSELRMLRS